MGLGDVKLMAMVGAFLGVRLTIFTIFGAAGDLAKRKLFPALYNLYLDGHLPERFSVLGVARAADHGAAVVNHTELVGLVKDGDRVSAARLLADGDRFRTGETVGQFRNDRLQGRGRGTKSKQSRRGGRTSDRA